MKNSFDDKAIEYDEWYEHNKFAYLSELEAVKKVLPREGRGIEIGVGSGRFASPLGIYVGIDPSEKMVELAARRGVDARKGKGEDLPYEADSFDYAVLIFTICFIENPAKVIAEAARILKPHGKLIVGIITKDSFLGKEYSEKGGIFYQEASFYTTEEVVCMLEEAGFGAFSYYQTLFKHPNKLKEVDKVLQGYDSGAFVVIRGEQGEYNDRSKSIGRC